MRKTASEIYFNKIAKDYDYYKNKNSFYYKNLKKILRDIIPRGKKVFEIGCGTGDLLASLEPREGYGMDISDQMVVISKRKYQNSKNLIFSTHWPKRNLPAGRQEFDFIFMSDVVEHLENPEDTFRKVSKMMDKDTLFINMMANPLWEPILIIAEKLGLKMPEGPHKRITDGELKDVIEKAGLKITKHDYKLLMPVEIPLLTDFINKYLEKYFKRLAVVECFVITKV